MIGDFELLVEKEAMWAEMLGQVLKDHNIEYAAVPVCGAGLTLKAGVRERFKIYVPAEKKTRAEELLNELFPEDGTA